MEFILVVCTSADGSFEVIRKIQYPTYSVFIVRERPWGYKEGQLLW